MLKMKVIYILVALGVYLKGKLWAETTVPYTNGNTILYITLVNIMYSSFQ